MHVVFFYAANKNPIPSNPLTHNNDNKVASRGEELSNGLPPPPLFPLPRLAPLELARVLAALAAMLGLLVMPAPAPAPGALALVGWGLEVASTLPALGLELVTSVVNWAELFWIAVDGCVDEAAGEDTADDATADDTAALLLVTALPLPLEHLIAPNGTGESLLSSASLFTSKVEPRGF